MEYFVIENFEVTHLCQEGIEDLYGSADIY